MIDIIYSKKWRFKLGFTNKNDFQKYFKAKDKLLEPLIDMNYIFNLNQRLKEIVTKIIAEIFLIDKQNKTFFIKN